MRAQHFLSYLIKVPRQLTIEKNRIIFRKEKQISTNWGLKKINPQKAILKVDFKQN